ncbi:MAG: DinB family protein [Actinomycetota bacterium]|nr:DinB family protein [Actinomycetota bacterium]
MSRPFPEPTTPIEDQRDVLLGYLAFYRSVLVDKLEGLDDESLHVSRLPSGWSPLELLNHLTHVEMRWLEWGFEGREVGDPWGDSRDGRWHVEPGVSLAQLVTSLHEQAARSEAVVRAHDLSETGAPGERWEGEPPAALGRILLHLLQEYARHVGHLDIVRELADGRTGER